ncbi:hypothetical protein Hanom_Chr10g00918481 [Helianthus anomalus]
MVSNLLLRKPRLRSRQLSLRGSLKTSLMQKELVFGKQGADPKSTEA